MMMMRRVNGIEVDMTGKKRKLESEWSWTWDFGGV
jgi:hypothetical protein